MFNSIYIDKTKGIDTRGAAIFSKAGSRLGELDIESLRCSVCHLLLREAHQNIECGHRYCCPCVEIVKKLKVCPEDQEPIQEGEIRIDKGCQKEIQRLIAECPGKKNGCTWKDFLLLLEDHILQCQYVEQDCEYGCGAKITRDQWSSHALTCPNKPHTCSYCSQEISPSKLEEHYKTCQGFPVACEGCRKEIPRGKLSTHTNQCPKKHAKCKFPDCDFEGLIEDLNKHSSAEHSYALVSDLQQVKAENKSLHRLLEELVMKVNKLEASKSQSVELEKRVKSLEDQVDTILPSLKTRVTALENEVQALNMNSKKTATEQDSGFRRTPPEGRYGGVYLDSGLGRSYGSTGGFSSGTSTGGFSSGSSGYSSGSDDDIRSLGSRVNNLEHEVRFSIKNSIDEVKSTLSQTKSQLAGCIDTVQTMQESVTRHAVTMEEVKLRQDILDVKTTHGIFVWKIPEINRRYGDAQARRTLSLYSPPFHASAHGYRMCIRAYLNGDGSGKQSHISIFFVLMKSEHDNLLPWPFRRPVTFQLVNQENPSSTISETFMPDVGSPSFQQPKSEMNVASGFPRFAKQTVLNDNSFTKGDAIFIRCKVDMTGLNLD